MLVPSNGAQEPHSLNPYLDILVDEHFTMLVLLYILDYPGMCKTLSVVGSGGLQGCMFCDIQGDRNQYVDKTIYLQNRRFISPESCLRNDKKRQLSAVLYMYIARQLLLISLNVHVQLNSIWLKALPLSCTFYINVHWH